MNIPVLPMSIEEVTARLTQAWDRLANDPQRDQFLEAMDAYRKERDAEDDAAEATKDTAEY
jgi:hypothetical protein